MRLVVVVPTPFGGSLSFATQVAGEISERGEPIATDDCLPGESHRCGTAAADASGRTNPRKRDALDAQRLAAVLAPLPGGV
jgi:hypothetical protein